MPKSKMKKTKAATSYRGGEFATLKHISSAYCFKLFILGVIANTERALKIK